SGKPDPDRWRPETTPDLARPPVLKNLPDRVKALLDLMVLAFWTDTTRVVSFMLANDNSRLVFDFLGVNEEHHYLSHFVRHSGVGGGTLKPGRWVRYAEPQPYANLLLSLLHRLGVDATSVGSSTGPLPGLDRPLGPSPGVTDDGTWRVVFDNDHQVTVRGFVS